MYQALYRKYRPKTLNEVYGQPVITRTLTNEVINDKISHAYIFSGPRGTGKTSVAKIFSKMINCRNLKDGIPCNKCVSCTQTNNGQDTDVIEIDAASNNGVDEVRELKSKVNLVPSYGKYKVYIIDEVHMMTTSAFNALLKVLEEPPVHIVFILATTDLQKIPATIMSRCQLFEFKKIPPKHIEENLLKIKDAENINIEIDAIAEIAQLANGAMRDAIGMLDQAVSYCSGNINKSDIKDLNGNISDEDLMLFVAKIFEGDIEYVYQKTNEYYNSGKNLNLIAEQIMITMKTILFELLGLNVNKTNIDISTLSKTGILEMINIINKTLYDMQRATNSKLQFELMLIQLMPTTNEIINKTEITHPASVLAKEVKSVPTIDQSTVKEPIEIVSANTNVFDEIIKLRVNNALANIEKTTMKQIILKKEEVKTYLGSSKYKKVASLLADGVIKAYGNNQIILVYEDVYMSNLLNYNVLQAEELIKKITNENYKLIAINKDAWDIIKKDYNSKDVTYTFQAEDPQINLIITKLLESKDCDEIMNTFGNVVKYNKE